MALGADAYCTLADLVAEGVLADEPEGDDEARYERLILSASRALDAWCRSWFWAKSYTSGAPLELNGRGGNVVRLPAPPIAVTAVKTVDRSLGTSTWETVDAAYYVVEDDPQNPSIQRFDGAKWPKGPKSIRVVGSLGHLEPDEEGTDATPIAIQRATIRLVALEKGPLGSRHDAQDRLERAGRIKSKSTNGRSVTFADTAMSVYSGDEVVDATIARYRRAFL